MDSRELIKLSDRIAEEITTSDRTLLSIFPITKYMKYMEQYPRISGYGYVSQEVKDLCKGIVNASGEHMLELYHQLILVNLILVARHKIERKDLTEDIKKLYNSNFGKIMKEIESKSHIGSYNYTCDKFRKNLAVCSLRMIPVGAQKIHLSGISRAFFIRKGFSQFVKGITYALFELGGFWPLYEMHTDSYDAELMGDFNEEGWIKFYRRVSDLLKIQTDVRGIFGCSWFFDPELEKISPRLLYLRKLSIDNGGKLFCLGSDSQSIKDAILKSPTRKRLYAENKYMPTNYLLVWSRKKLISWADGKK
jgi:hypothetical protein